ncbi:MAG: Glycine oxidase ThiO [Hydrogenibacillus schlegelii]|uniref:glycine oxidase n=1 Tax=Hydrogenibacillus schlegelii TaxID=1484 RepID=A0A2T5GD29_HYDSH|nr:MAG: Glycine oxidase ThiO [Hydrogenibacillus schlegelii]
MGGDGEEEVGLGAEGGHRLGGGVPAVQGVGGKPPAELSQKARLRFKIRREAVISKDSKDKGGLPYCDRIEASTWTNPMNREKGDKSPMTEGHHGQTQTGGSVPDAADVLVVGGGMIGLAIARQLAVRGVRVIVAEQAGVGSGASQAAAGMLAAQVETEEDGPFFDLQVASRRLWQKWAHVLPEETGVAIGYRKTGMYRIAGTPHEAEMLQKRLEWQTQKGQSVTWLDAERLRAAVPGLGPEVYGALYAPEDHQVDAVLALRALRLSAVWHGALVMEGTPVISLLKEGARIYGVRTPKGVLTADRVVLAGGLSVPALLEPLGFTFPLEPVRGVACALLADRPFLRETLFGTGWYLTPKADGRLIVGATEEGGAAAAYVPAESLMRILERAMRAVPEIGRFPFRSAWSGIRTRTPDGLPVIGPVPGVEGLFVATGHHRNGILLAPVTGETIAEWIVGQKPPAVAMAFLPERFLKSGSDPTERRERDVQSR